MELRQLEYFVAVAEEANFTRGAERAHVSQSGISAQIRQLGRDLGAELFARSSRTVARTAAGTSPVMDSPRDEANSDCVVYELRSGSPDLPRVGAAGDRPEGVVVEIVITETL